MTHAAVIRGQLATLRPKVKRIEIAELPGAEVYVRALNGRERAQLVARLAGRTGQDPVGDAEIVLYGLCDASGVRVYGDADADLAEVEQLDGLVLYRISGEIMRMAGLAKGSTEDAEKN